MASEWFYQVLEEQVGPISSAELWDLAEHGRVTRDTLVKNTPGGTWVPAVFVRGLFAVSSSKSPPINVSAAGERPADSAIAPKPTRARSNLLVAKFGMIVAIVVLLVSTAIFVHLRQSKAPQAARDAMKAIKELQAKTETGLLYVQYVDAVAKTWAEVKPFVESPEAKRNYPEFSSLLASIIAQYEGATEAWESQSRASLYLNEADVRIKEAESLLDAELSRPRNPRVIAIERELDTIGPRFRQISNEYTKLSTDAERYSRMVRTGGNALDVYDAIDIQSQMGIIMARMAAIGPEIPKSLKRIVELNNERSSLLQK